ncbi:DUF1186 domain-containing protein [Trichocoleus desertorum AS-A10]|uniref:DUF1186 domain-containing protein n=1 Tax=Trichocoleus desertorum TaxID=1481672 RepID=UPI0032997FF7
MASDYAPPVDRLLVFGHCRDSIANWPDHPKVLELGPEYIPDLIRMATDEELWLLESEGLEIWAPIHAWRSLGQLRAEAAIEPLLSLLHRMDDEGNDWIGEELPEVFGMIGAAAISALSTYLADKTHGLSARTAASEALVKIAEQYPETQEKSIAAIAHQLEQFTKNNPVLNGMLVAALLDLKAVEAAPVMERAFAANRVDETIAGDWEEVQLDLGMVSKLELRQRRFAASQRPVVDFSTVTQPKPDVTGFGSSSSEQSKKKGKKKK